MIENDIFKSQKQFHGCLNRMLRTKATRKRVQKMMMDTKHRELNKDDNDTNTKKKKNNKKQDKKEHLTIISYIQKTMDCGIASCISVVSSIFHVLFSLNGSQMMALGICIALLTNVLMAYRLSNISSQLDTIEHSKKPFNALPSSSFLYNNDKNKNKRKGLHYNTQGVYQLEQSIDAIHDAMFHLQNDIRDQSDRLYRLRRL